MKLIGVRARSGLVKLTVLIAMTLLFSLSCNGCSDREKTASEPQGAEAPYEIGAVLCLTGRGETYGERAYHGMQMAIDELNATDRFRERPIRLLVEDSASSATQSLSAFRKLIEINQVPVAVGFVLSDEVLTCAPVANEREVVLFSVAAGSDKIKDAGDFIFRNRESAVLQAGAIASACINRFGFQEVAIMHSNAANGISYRNQFRNALESFDGKVTRIVAYNEGKSDYRAEIRQLMAASPKAVYLAGLDHELGLILKQSKELGYEPQFFGSAGAISPKLLEIAGTAAEGLVCGSAPFDAASQAPHLHAFVKGYEDRYGRRPDWIAANAYDAIRLVAEFLLEGDTTGPEIRDGLYATSGFPGVGGETSFDEYGEVRKPITLVQVRGGRFAPLAGE